MKRRVFTQAFLFGLFCGPAFAADPLPTLQETPMLAEQVKSGALPPVAERIPNPPWIVRRFAGGDGPGQPGGQLNMLVASARDTRLMTIFSYTRLIIYDDQFKLHPDILESYEAKDGREFTIKYSWDKPNPYFIESQARAAPLFLFRPAHYLKKFHAKYTDPAEINKSAKGGQAGGSWIQIYRRLDVMFNNDSVDLPSLNPWINTTPSPAQRFVFARNPYYHRIDEKGHQLPYIDRVIFTVAATTLIPAKAG